MYDSFLSIMGMYDADPTIFDAMSLPESIDRDTAVTEICLTCAELEILYPEPQTLALAIKSWSKKSLANWEHIADALAAEYNPLWNKDGTITESRQVVRDLANSSNSVRDLLSTGGSSSDASSEGKESAYNESGYHEATMSIDESSISTESHDTGTVSNNGTDTGTISETYSRVEKGNIGLTTTQALLTEEVKVRESYNIYGIIAEDFKKRFCIMVY